MELRRKTKATGDIVKTVALLIYELNSENTSWVEKQLMLDIRLQIKWGAHNTHDSL